ncbi:MULTISPECIES: hypothetical protein [unclassified Rathayibacter]|uniref:hypothetical protein n=1 Tax=unclassified Rathayibacter TaxID=2609250 RepID=UPI001C2064CD|nr:MULTISPECIES: hypothetical protein [unclassified Rathayibacter]
MPCIPLRTCSPTTSSTDDAAHDAADDASDYSADDASDDPAHDAADDASDDPAHDAADHASDDPADDAADHLADGAADAEGLDAAGDPGDVRNPADDWTGVDRSRVRSGPVARVPGTGWRRTAAAPAATSTPPSQLITATRRHR